MTGASGIYGQSLYRLASEEKIEEQLMEELTAVRAIFAENPDYVRLLAEPSVPRAERVGLVDEAFGGQVHPYLLNFLKIITENGMIRSFSGCFKTFRSLYNSDHGITDAVVTSAVELTEDQVKRLTAKLESLTGKKVLMTRKTDPSVLGGMRVELDGMLYDGTVSGKLADIGKQVREIVL